MRACVVAWVVAVVAAAAVSCAPPDEDRCGDSGKYWWDATANSCFAVITDTGDPVPSVVDSTPDSDTDTVIDGIGDPCNYFGQDKGGCAGKEASFCAYNLPYKKGQCSTTCSDTTNSTDCPEDWNCCNFIAGEPAVFCMPPDFWDIITVATCSNK